MLTTFFQNTILCYENFQIRTLLGIVSCYKFYIFFKNVSQMHSFVVQFCFSWVGNKVPKFQNKSLALRCKITRMQKRTSKQRLSQKHVDFVFSHLNNNVFFLNDMSVGVKNWLGYINLALLNQFPWPLWRYP